MPEPSIEEILASIRRSIVPEDPAAGDAVPGDAPAARSRRSRRHAAASGDDAPGRDGSGAAAAIGRETDGQARGRDANGHDGAVVRRGAAANDTVNGAVTDTVTDTVNDDTVTWRADGPLLSGRTASAVDTAFAALKDTVVTHNPPTLEDLAREMLRPMLKAWLDANLPGLVERLVQAEIERVSRRG